MALALRLAAYELLRADGGDPVLLLDDVFAELDTARRQALANVAASAEQVLVTAAVHEDIPAGLGCAQDRDHHARRRRRAGSRRCGDERRSMSRATNEREPPAHLAHLKGMDLVRRTLEEARGAARSQGKDVGRGGRGRPPRRVAGTSRRRWSGPGPDSRDPQALGSVARDVARNRGWSGRVAEGAVFGRWPAVVGEQIAAHAAPTALTRRCADGFGGVDRVGDPAADGAGAAVGEDRGGGRRRGRHVAEDRRPDGAVVAQRPLSHRRPRAPRHVRMRPCFSRWLRAATRPRGLVLKRLDAPRTEKFHRTARIGVQKRRLRIGPDGG